MRAFLPINVDTIEIKRLNTLMLADLLEQFFGGGRGGHVQFGSKSFYTGLVLAQSKVILPLAAVTPHQAAVGVLAATVARQDELA
jgi:hypothetical protein